MAASPYYDYETGAAPAVVSVPAGKFVQEASCIAGDAGCTMAIGSGDPIDVPAGSSFSPWPNRPEALIPGPIDITFAGDVTSYFVAWSS